MRKPIALFLACLLLVTSAFALVGCGDNGKTSAEYQYDEDSHWKEENGEETDVGYHDYEIVGSAADYDHAGEMTYTCKVCGYSFTESEEQLEHEYAAAFTPDEAYEEHYHYRKCLDDDYEDLYVDRSEHDFEVVQVKSSFEELGYDLHRCKDCGYSYKDNYDNLLMSHTYNWEFLYNDEEHWRVCADPGYEDLITDKATHSFLYEYVMVGEVYYQHKFCRWCDYSYDYDFYIPSTQLDYESEWSHDSGEHWHKCVTKGYENSKLFQDNHQWTNEGDGWEVITQPTEFTDGLRKRVCSVCGYEEKQVLGSTAASQVEFLTLRYDEDKEVYYISGYKGEPVDLSIPQNAYGKPIAGIDNKAFYSCKTLKTVTFAEASLVESFGDRAFANSTLEEIKVMPTALTTIGDKCFYGCKQLTAFTISENVTTIGDIAFFNCSKLANVNLNATLLTKAGSKQYPIFNKLKSFTKLTIANNVQRIPQYFCYYATKLKSVTFEDSKNSSLTLIGKYAFFDTAITSFTFPQNVKTVNEAAFAGCTHLTDIKYNAENCTKWNIPFTKKVITDVNSSAVKLAKEIKLTIGNTVKKIPEKFLYKINRFKTITFQKGSVLEEIGKKAFYYLDKVESLTIPDSVETIGDEAFAYMKNLKSMTIGNGIDALSKYMLIKNKSLTEINYTGTCAEWEALKKENKWNDLVPATVVHCTDGDVKL